MDATQARFVTIAVTDTNGLLRGQKIAARNLPGILENGVGMAPAQLALDPTDEILTMPGVTDDSADFHDATLEIDTESGRDMPWDLMSDSSLYLAEFTGDAAYLCPRSILRDVLARAEEMDIFPTYGFEQEFTVFDETHASLAEKGYDNLVTATPHGSRDLIIYQALQSEFYRDVADICEPLGISLGKMHEEIGGGFMEACIEAGTGLDPADQVILLKNFVRALAMRQGQSVSYMPRWSEHADSQSAHIHVSLRDGKGKPLFWDNSAPNHISQTFRHFLGGLQQYLPGMMLVFAPTVNSWRRFAENTFAPDAFSWGLENRTCCFRVVGHSPSSLRFENRLPGADANPYLTMAATLSAGLAGIAETLEPTAPTVGNGYNPEICNGAPFTETMDGAIAALRASDHAKEWLGSRFIETFSATRECQQQQFIGDDLIAERRRFFELG